MVDKDSTGTTQRQRQEANVITLLQKFAVFDRVAQITKAHIFLLSPTDI